MSSLLERVEGFETICKAFAVAASASAADQAVEVEMSAVKAAHSRGGFLLADRDTLERYESDYRAQYDEKLRAQAAQIEVERIHLGAELRDEIAAAEQLPSTAQTVLGVSTEARLMAELVDEVKTSNLRQELKGLTRQQLLDRYQKWTDRDDRAAVRLVEHHVLTGTVDRLGVKDEDDPTVDAVTIPKLQQVIAQRRRARVSQDTLDAQARLDKVFGLSFEHSVRHLRSGRGFATRPTAA